MLSSDETKHQPKSGGDLRQAYPGTAGASVQKQREVIIFFFV